MADRRKDRRLGLQKMFDDYVERLQNDFTTGAAQSAQGVGDIVERGNVLTGIPRIALGGLGWMGSPVSAAVSPVLGPLLAPVAEATDTYVGQPVERMTGYPADLTNEIFLSTAIPVAGSKIGKMASPYLSRLADAAETGANRAGYTFRPDEGTRFTFGGPTALTADKVKLAQAQKMAADGLSRDEIWNQTGWFQGVDGKWRFEIDDSASAISEFMKSASAQPAGARAGSVFMHPELYAAYPQLAEIRITNSVPKGARGASYSGRVGVSDELPSSEAKSTLLHELQHEIQNIEGFAKGGNPAEFAFMNKALAEDALWLKNYIEMEGGTEAGVARFIKTVGRVPHEKSVRAAVMPWDDLVGASNPERAYQRLAGEVEPRNVQFRRGMTKQERAASFPLSTQDIPTEQQTLRGVNRPP